MSPQMRAQKEEGEKDRSAQGGSAEARRAGPGINWRGHGPPPRQYAPTISARALAASISRLGPGFQEKSRVSVFGESQLREKWPFLEILTPFSRQKR